MLYLHGMGHFHPNNVIDNSFLESLDIETNNEWIMQRVGIAQRRSALSLDYIRQTYNQDPLQAIEHSELTGAQMGAQAALMAFERSGLQPDDIGMVIAGGCSMQYALPAHATIVAAELGIEAEAVDINSACSTFAAHMHFLNRTKAEELPDYILLITSENWTNTIDYSDRATAVLVGDCAVATIVSTKKKTPCKISYTTLTSSPSGWNKVMSPIGKHFYQNGHAVQKFAIQKTRLLIENILAQTNIDHSTYYFIGHQANLMMLQAVCRKDNIPADRHLFNVNQFGNCAAAGAPSVLSQHWGKFRPGDNIVLAVVGAGLTWGGMLIEYR